MGGIVIETVNIHKSANRTLAVIDGGLNVKTHPQILQRARNRSC
jgi:hypothetical protein